MRERIKNFIARVDELTLRERASVFAALVTVLFLGWYTYLVEPLQKQEAALQSELETRRGQLQTLSEQFVLSLQMQSADPNAANRDRLSQLRAEEKRIQEELRTATANLVAPEALPELLRQVLRSADGLTLASMSGLGSTPLVKPAGDGTLSPAHIAAGGDDVLEGAYRHGMQLQFSADFFTTLAYLRQLESLQWRFLWDSITYTVSEYPEATTSIRLYTLSLSPDWIGT